MQLEEFLKTKLTSTDLRNYEEMLNNFYKNYIASRNELFAAKNQLANNKITNEEYQKVKAKQKQVTTEYKKVLKNKHFKKNWRHAQKLLRHTSKKSPSWKRVKDEYSAAAKLYSDYKTIINTRGQFSRVPKLSNYAIEVDDLCFCYNSESSLVLNKVSFKITEGDYVAVVGHNGSGKSTLSKILIGVLNATQGTVKIFGNPLNSENISQIRQFLGIVFQNPDNQFIGSTVRADIAFGLENRCVLPDEMPQIIERAAKMVEMEKFLDSEPLNLSGGQKQRVAIASAIALNPEILIFDEATSMLDPKGKHEIKDIILFLRKQRKKTILSITHDMDEILNADKVLVLNQGQVVRYASPIEIINEEGFLQSIHLGIPFIHQVYEELKKNDINIKKPITIDDLVEELCAKKIE